MAKGAERTTRRLARRAFARHGDPETTRMQTLNMLVNGLFGGTTPPEDIRTGERDLRQGEPGLEAGFFGPDMLVPATRAAGPLGRLSKRKTKQKIGGGQPPAEGFVPVLRNSETKEVFFGSPGEMHFQIFGRHADAFPKGPSRKAVESGFAGPDGKFLTREEAAEIVRKQIKDFDTKQTDRVGRGLHSTDLSLLPSARARRTTDGE